MAEVAQHHHRLTSAQDRAGAGEGQLASDVPPTALPSHRPGPRAQQASDRHRLEVGDRELAGDRQYPVQQAHVPQDLIEYARGPAAVSHLGAALVLRSADQIRVHRAVLLEFLAAEPEAAGAQAPARPAQRDR